MDTRRIEYKDGMPFYPVTFPVNEADGLVIEDLQLQNLIQYLNEKDVKSAYIYAMENFLFLENCSRLEHIKIELQLPSKYYSKLGRKRSFLEKIYDDTPLYALKKLKGISIIDTEEPFIISKLKIDLSKFSALEEYCGEWKYTEKIQEAYSLKSLWLNHYGRETLEELSGLKKIDTLRLCASKIKSLKGCGGLENLECLYLDYNRSLTDISELENVKHSLKLLKIENCGKIADFSVLEKLENLEALVLVGSNTLPNLSFLNKLKRLKSFIFTMKIADGDLSPCLRLQYACCVKGSRRYNLTDRKLPKGEFVRGNEHIEKWRRFE